MRTILAVLMVGTMVMGCGLDADADRPAREWRAYDYNRPDPNYGSYDASRYYRQSPRYRERRLSEHDRIYRGHDDRYYCRRSDGSTGLIVGAIAGGILGNIIAPGGSETVGTILGAGLGALGGQAIDRDNMRCR
jgi:hypothetical protein